jgi:hypothetical protein
MNLNPEFQRNLWLEVSLHRLIGMPLVLGMVFLLVGLGGDKDLHLGVAALWIFNLFAFGWGTYLAGETVTSEVKHRTWDLQRLTSISPWSMTWGKLLGCTIYPWYGALICLGVAVADGAIATLTHVFTLVIAAVISQTVALLASLLTITRGKGLDRSAAVAHLFIGNLAAAPFWMSHDRLATVTWFGHAFDTNAFMLGSAMLWGAWALIGCYRTMATELQVASGPTAWIAFVATAWLYCIGFAYDPVKADEQWHIRLMIGLALTVVMTYLTLFNDRKEPAGFRRMLVAAGRKQWAKVAVDVPLWLPTVVMAGLFATALAWLLVTDPFDPASSLGKDKDLADGLKGAVWLAAIYLFVLRDIAITLFFNIGSKRVRADLTALLYLAVLYTLIPGILWSLELKTATYLFLPWIPTMPGLSLVSGAVQTGLAVALVLWRWRRGFGAPRPITEA